MRTVNEYAADVKRHYIEACEAVLGRGGNIPSGMPMSDLPLAISNIPHDVTLAYHEVNSTAYRTLVPQNAEPYARINKIGGKSHKTRNLIPYPYAEKNKTMNGITFTDNGDGTVTVNGTATANATFWLCSGVKLDRLIAGSTYIPSTGNSAIGSGVILMCNYEGTDGVQKNFTTSEIGARTYPSNTTKDMLYLLVQTGTTVNNAIIKPMLNEGDTALPYEPYFEGLRDTKTTALKSEGANLAHSISEGSNTTITDGVVTQIEADTYEEAIFKCQLYSKTGYQSGGIVKWLYATGVHSATFNKEGAETRCVFGINGKSIDTVIVIDITDLPIGEYTVSANFTNITQGSISWKDIMLNAGSVAIPYTPYVGTLDTLAIPEEVQSLDGYGQGKSDTEYNFIDLINKTFPKEYGKVVLPSNTGGYNAENNWYYIGVGIGIAPISRDVLCNLSPSVDIAAYTEAEGIYMNSSLSHIILRKSGFTTQEEYRQWLTDNEVYIIERLAEPVVTDISEYLTDEFIKVEGGGPITAVNEREEGVPTSVTYLIETVGG